MLLLLSINILHIEMLKKCFIKMKNKAINADNIIFKNYLLLNYS